MELTAELIVDAALPADSELSPDGRWVVYTLGTVGRAGRHPVSALWLAAADGSSPPRKLTAGTAHDHEPRWAPDSATVYFGSDRREPGVTQLHRISVDGGEAEALTRWRGGISGWLPLTGSRLVAVTAVDEPTEEDERRRRSGDDAKVWGERVARARLRLLDPDTGELRAVTGLDHRHVAELTQRPDGGPLAVLSWEFPEIDPVRFGIELHLADPETGTVRDLGPTAPEAANPAWWRAGDGWHLAYLSRTPGSSVGGHALFDLAVPDSGTAAAARNLTTGMSSCPVELVQVAEGPPLALFAAGLDTAVHRLDPATGRFQHLSTVEGGAHSLSANRDGTSVAALVSTTYRAAEVHAGAPADPLTRLSDHHPELDGIVWGRQERLSYQASDGLDLQALLVLPSGRDRTDGPFPLITLVHGGPYGRYADELRLALFPYTQWLATAGYAVFLPNPRGSMGRGHEFAATVAGAVGQEEWDDLLAGIDLLVEQGVADPERLGIGGWSHGGFVTAWAVGQTDRFAAAVMGAGISDWGMLAGTGEWGTMDGDLGGSIGWEGTGPHPHQRLSPISYASRVRTPLLILHGEEDQNVPLGQAIYLHRALRWYGAEHRLVVYPREGHGIRERGHKLDLLRQMREWFGQWLGDPATGESAAGESAAGESAAEAQTIQQQ